MNVRRRDMVLLGGAAMATLSGCISGGSNLPRRRATLYQPKSGSVCGDELSLNHPETGKESQVWPQPHYDAEFSGFSPNTGPKTLERGWTLSSAQVQDWSTGGELYSIPVPVTLAEGLLLVQSTTGLHGVDASSGEPRWSIDTPTLGQFPVLLREQQAILIGPGEDPDVPGHIKAFDLEDRSESWIVELDIHSWPVLHEDTVFVATSEGLRGLSVSTGEFRTAPLTGPDESVPGFAPIVDGTHIGTARDQVYALDTSSGSVQWTTELQSPPDRGISDLGGPIASSSGIFIATNYAPTTGNTGGLRDMPTTFESLPQGTSKLHALDPSSGERLWSYPFDGSLLRAQPANVGEAVIVGGLMDARLTERTESTGFIAAIDARQGCRRWWTTFQETESYPIPSFAIANERIYCTTGTGHKGTATPSIYIFDATDGTLIDRTALGDVNTALPTVANGAVYLHLTTNDGGARIVQLRNTNS